MDTNLQCLLQVKEPSGSSQFTGHRRCPKFCTWSLSRLSYTSTVQLNLHGLDIAGDWAAGGPPGTKRPDPQSLGLRISPGKAIVTDKEGQRDFYQKCMRKCECRGQPRQVLQFMQHWYLL